MNTFRWQVQDRFLEMKTQWLTLVGEHLIDEQSQTLEYWRIEKADAVIILPIYNDQLLMPLPMYRPGVGDATWDFPGGRVPEGKTPHAAVPSILQRELGVAESAIATIKPLNSTGWAINSAFSNQRLYGFVVAVNPEIALSLSSVGKRFETNLSGIHAALGLLTCLQCRTVLLDWWLTTVRDSLVDA